MLSWKEKEENTKVTTKMNANTKPALRKKGKEPDPRPIPNYRNLYEDIEDADDPSEAEVFKDVVDDADMSEPTTSRVPQVGTSRPAGSTTLQSKPAMVAEEDPAARLERLKDRRLLVGV